MVVDADRFAVALDRLRHTAIQPTEKGFAAIGPITPAELVGRQLQVYASGLTTPLMVLRAAALRNNVDVMAAWCAARGALHAPHAKTTMSPQVVARQVDAGAWAVTVANLHQLRALHALGVRRFLVANQVTDRAAIRWLAAARRADPGLDVACYVDSPAGADLLAAEPQPPLPVLIELGVPGGRTGVRDVEAARRLAGYTEKLNFVNCGVAGFEGTLGHDRSAAALEAVRGFCRRLGVLAELLLADGTLRPTGAEGFAGADIMSAGGSVYFDVVAEELPVPGTRLVLRPGGYVAQDRGYLSLYSPLPALRPAFETLATVLSRPEPGLALLGAGKRDLPFDLGMPEVLDGGTTRTVFKLEDQHAYLALDDEDPLAPGDVVRLGGAHPCTAFDKWRFIPVLDEDDRIVDVFGTLF